MPPINLSTRYQREGIYQVVGKTRSSWLGFEPRLQAKAPACFPQHSHSSEQTATLLYPEALLRMISPDGRNY